MTTAKDFTSKVAVTFVALAMIFGMFAPATQAQTTEDLQQMINTLLAQIAALQAQAGQETSASGFVWTRDLSQGSTGADVMELQKFLNSDPDTRVSASGAGSAGMETSYYGPATAAAVSKFQVKYRAEILSPAGLVNPTGYFGPSSRTKANSMNAPVTTPTTPSDDEDEDDDTTTTPTTPALQGGEGDVTFQTLTDGAITIDLGKAETVLEFEAEANDSDIAINRIDFEFSSTTGTVRPWLYFDEVNLLVDGEEVATLSRSSDYTDIGSGKYRARFSGLNIVIREDQTADIALELVALDSMGGTRANDKFDVTLGDLRFVDGAGFSETYSYGGDRTATVDFEEVFGEGDVKISVADNSPEKATIVLNKSSRTNGVTILNIDVEAEDGDMEVTDVHVDLKVSTTTPASVGSIFNRARLYVGNTLLSTKSITGTGTTTTVEFDKVDFKISKDDTREFRVEVDFNNGETITPHKFTVGSTTVWAENNNFVSDNDSVDVNETHNIIVEGLVAEKKSATATAANNSTTLTFRFDVTAYGSDFWINESGSSVVAAITLPATSTIASSSVQVAGVTKNSSGNFRIQKGQTREVTISYIITNNGTAAGFISGHLVNLVYGTTATTATGEAALLGAPDFEVPTNTTVSAPN
jgi:hypothetical protein